MIRTLRTMLTCHWSAKRVQRYLDADPSARLEPHEVHRLEDHLAVCERCRGLADEYRMLHGLLQRWAQRTLPDPQSVARAHDVLDQITDGRIP